MLAAHEQRSETRWIVPSEELENSPSRRDGIRAEEEKKKRRQTVSYIEECGKKLNLRKLTVVVAETYLNRFYAVQSFKRYDRFVAAQACLFLAAKVEEQTLRIDRVVGECHAVRYGERKERLAPDSAAFLDAKASVLEYERVLLYSVNYDFDILNLLPVHYLEPILRKLRHIGVGDDSNFSQQCWNFIQDSHRTNLGLQFSPKKIASACVFLAFFKLRTLPTDKTTLKNTFEILSISQRTLNTICFHMAELYVEMKARHNAALLYDLHAKGHVPTELYDRSRLAFADPASSSSNQPPPPAKKPKLDPAAAA